MTALFTRLSAILGLALFALSACVPTSPPPETAVAIVEEEGDAAAVIVPTVTPPQTEIETDPATYQPNPTEEVIDAQESMTPTSEILIIAEPDSTLPHDADAQKAIQLTQKSLAKQLDIAVEDVTFLNYQPQTLPDGSMGCRQGGKMYTPVEIPGYIIRLQVAEDVYEFHGGMGRRPFLCQSKALNDTKPGEIIVPPPINK